jgi:hypothetical protein
VALHVAFQVPANMSWFDITLSAGMHPVWPALMV